MAKSPAHKFGQIVGKVLESAIEPLLSDFASQHSLYLDQKGARPCRKGLKCSWTDLNGNKHDLDFVLERGGSPDKHGMPVAFVETAWRRYTKHSRNKAQEIQGAVEPLAETFRGLRPFKGAVLAGVFTKGALQQLTSLGFSVVYIPYESIVSVFKRFGIDASSEENTPETEFEKKVKAYEQLSPAKRRKLASSVVNVGKDEIDTFFSRLDASISRSIERIVVLPLHGRACDLTTIEEAVAFIQNYEEDKFKERPLTRYEIQIKYNNGDIVEGKFGDKQGALEFIREFQPIAP